MEWMDYSARTISTYPPCCSGLSLLDSRLFKGTYYSFSYHYLLLFESNSSNFLSLFGKLPLELAFGISLHHSLNKASRFSIFPSCACQFLLFHFSYSTTVHIHTPWDHIVFDHRFCLTNLMHLIWSLVLIHMVLTRLPRSRYRILLPDLMGSLFFGLREAVP